MRVPAAALAGAFLVAASPAAAQARDYPHVPEPMVFDMIRPMGARAGELEANVLTLSPLSGQERAVEWAPEVEYALLNGLAVEFELPFENTRLAEVKMGVQGTFGTFDAGRIVHGVQYLGIYDRQDRSTSHAVLYMLGRRHSARWSTLSMVGVGDVRVGQSERRAGLLVNHSTFYDLAPGRVLGLEINWNAGPDGGVLAMPQVHAAVGSRFSLQVGAGVDKQRGARARPVAGLRLIREF